MKGLFSVYTLLCICISIKIQAQENTIGIIPDSLKIKTCTTFEIPDSLKGMSFEALNRVFLKVKFDIPKAEVYAKTYLAKAKKEQIKSEIAEGYFFMTAVREKELDLEYADSIIAVTKDFKNHKYPGMGHLLKGSAYYEMGDYRACLEEYLIAADYARKNDNEFQYLSLKFNIGVIKTSLGENEEALDIFRSFVSYMETEGLQEKYPESYNRSLYNLADSYAYMKKIDSANFIIDKGIQVTLQTNDSLVYPYFVLNSGVNLFLKAKYQQALDSLTKAKKYIEANVDKNDSKVLLMHQYLGKSHAKLGNGSRSIEYYEKVDELLQTTKDINPELVESYKALIAYYKSKNNNKKQLYYISRLLHYDSILDADYKFLSKKIVKSYEKSELKHEKQLLLEELDENKKYTNYLIKAIFILLVVSLGIIFYYVRKSTLYKRRFKALLNDKDYDKNTRTKKKIEESTTINMPEDVVHEIVSKLKAFEKSKSFISNYTMGELAKELQTNTAYLSKIINKTKGMNFSSYINNLRVSYAIDRLKNDEKFRKYTIKAIAQEVGFNKAQSFSVAFYKKTGIYPSYFIKEIEKQ